MDAFKKILMENDINVPSNVEFKGMVYTIDGKPLDKGMIDFLKWVFVPVFQSTSGIIIPRTGEFKIDAEKISPRTIINLSGLPNASASVLNEGLVQIYLGILFVFSAISNTVDIIFSILDKGIISFENLLNFNPPDEILDEIDGLFHALKKSQESNWLHIFLPHIGEKNINKHFVRITNGMASIIIGHELTHWFETIYKKEAWDKKLAVVDDGIESWLNSEHVLVKKEKFENAKAHLADKNIRKSWINEVNADIGAFKYSQNTATMGGWMRSPEILKETYILLEFLFSIVHLFEIFNYKNGIKNNMSTHPPSVIRRSIFHHIAAKRFGMSELDYANKQNGAGLAVRILMEVIIDKYLRER